MKSIVFEIGKWTEISNPIVKSDILAQLKREVTNYKTEQMKAPKMWPAETETDHIMRLMVWRGRVIYRNTS